MEENLGSKFIVQLVPGFPPSVNGLGDYALNLARKLREDFGIVTNFLVGDPAWQGPPELEGFLVRKVSARTGSDLSAALSACRVPVLLHYSGYGFARRGCPFWLIKGLREWRSGDASSRAITMFHEIYATGPVWKSEFWLSPIQQSIAASLMKMSDRCITSKRSYSDEIGLLSGGVHSGVPALPVFSNIGEPRDVPRLDKRARRMVIFGGAPRRKRLYLRGFGRVIDSCRQLGIEEVMDIGPSTGITLPNPAGLKIREIGALNAQAVSDIMAASLAGFSDANPYFLGKSGVFAAYCAHGLLPINSSACAGVVDGLLGGEHYWAAGNEGLLDIVKAQMIADNAYKWYRGHDLAAHAAAFAAILRALR